jgi:hypothetical protein
MMAAKYLCLLLYLLFSSIDDALYRTSLRFLNKRHYQASNLIISSYPYRNTHKYAVMTASDIVPSLNKGMKSSRSSLTYGPSSMGIAESSNPLLIDQSVKKLLKINDLLFFTLALKKFGTESEIKHVKREHISELVRVSSMLMNTPTADQLDAYSIAELVFSLGHLNKDICSLSDDHYSLVIASLHRLNRPLYRRQLNTKSFSKYLTGIVRLGVTSSKLPIEILLELITMDGILCNMDSVGISNLFWLLGKLGLNMQQLPVSLQRDMFKQVFETSKAFNSQSVSYFLTGLYQLGANWHELPVIIKSMISSMICRESPRASCRSIGKILFALGKMDANYYSLTDRLQIGIELGIKKAMKDTKSSINMNDRCDVLNGLALIGYTWEKLSTSTAEALANSVYEQALSWRSQLTPRSANDFNPKSIIAVTFNVSKVFQALHLLGLDWNNLPAPIKAALILGLNIISGYQYNQEQQEQASKLNVKMLYGASKASRQVKSSLSRRPGSQLPESTIALANEVEAYFNSSSSATFSAAETSPSSAEVLAELTAVGSSTSQVSRYVYTKTENQTLSRSISSIFYALSKLNLDLSRNTPIELSSQLHQLIRLFSHGHSVTSISIMMLSMSKIGFKCSDHYEKKFMMMKVNEVLSLEALHINSSSSSLSPVDVDGYRQSVSNIIFSLSDLGITWTDIRPYARKTLIQVIDNLVDLPLSIEGISSLFYAFSKLQLYHPPHLPYKLSEKLFQRFFDYYLADDLNHQAMENYARKVALSTKVLKHLGLPSLCGLWKTSSFSIDYCHSIVNKFSMLIDKMKPTMTPIALSTLLDSLSSLHSALNYAELEETGIRLEWVRQVFVPLMRLMQADISEMSMRHLGSNLNAINKLDLWMFAPSRLRQSLINRIDELFRYRGSAVAVAEVMLCLRGLSDMNGIRFEELASTTQSYLLQALSASMHRLGRQEVISIWSILVDSQILINNELRSKLIHMTSKMSSMLTQMECASIISSAYRLQFSNHDDEHLNALIESLWTIIAIPDSQLSAVRSKTRTSSWDEELVEAEVVEVRSMVERSIDVEDAEALESIFRPENIDALDQAYDHLTPTGLVAPAIAREDELEVADQRITAGSAGVRREEGVVNAVAAFNLMKRTNTRWSSFSSSIQSSFIDKFAEHLSSPSSSRKKYTAVDRIWLLGLLSEIGFPSFKQWSRELQKAIMLMVIENMVDIHAHSDGDDLGAASRSNQQQLRLLLYHLQVPVAEIISKAKQKHMQTH